VRKILVFFIISLNVSILLAQKVHIKNDSQYDERLFHFGFAFGINGMDLTFKRPASADTFYANVNQLHPGFQVSVVTDLRLGKYFSLRVLPGINLGQREITYYNRYNKAVSSMIIESNYLDMPLVFKYKAERIYNYRPYLFAGCSFKYDWAARKGYDEESNVYLRFKPFDYSFDFGVGFDYYLTYFKLSTELKISLGMRDILERTPAPGKEAYVNAIDRLTSRMVMLNFYIE
jgi:hypothetical protein